MADDQPIEPRREPERPDDVIKGNVWEVRLPENVDPDDTPSPPPPPEQNENNETGGQSENG